MDRKPLLLHLAGYWYQLMCKGWVFQSVTVMPLPSEMDFLVLTSHYWVILQTSYIWCFGSNSSVQMAPIWQTHFYVNLLMFAPCFIQVWNVVSHTKEVTYFECFESFREQGADENIWILERGSNVKLQTTVEHWSSWFVLLARLY
jgi:hypothetical protein